jgi:hypothetical protein
MPWHTHLGVVGCDAVRRMEMKDQAEEGEEEGEEETLCTLCRNRMCGIYIDIENI